MSSRALDATRHVGSSLSVRRPVVLATYGVLASLLIWSRVAGLGESLWHDEIYTIQRFVVPGPSAIFGGYNTNDHMLFSALAWLTVRLPGLSDIAYRLWAVIPSITGVTLVTAWLHRHAGAPIATLFAFLCTTSTQLLLLSTEARGYGIAFFAMATMTVSAYEASTQKMNGWLTAVAASGVAGCMTLPTFLLPFLGVTFVLLADPQLRRRLTLRLGLAFAALAAWYAVPAPALLSSRSQEFGVRLPWHAPLTGAATELAAAFVPTVTAAKLLPGIVVLPILLFGAHRMHRDLRGMTGIVLVPVVFTFLALTISRFYVEERFVSYLLVPLFVIAAFGLNDLATARTTGMRVFSVSYAAVAAGIALLVFAFFAIQHARLPREANREAAAAVTQALSRGARPVVLNTHHADDLVYYMGVVPLRKVVSSRLESYLCTETTKMGVIFVQQPYGVNPVDTACLMRLGASRHVFRQTDRGRRITVWAVPPRDSRTAGR